VHKTEEKTFLSICSDSSATGVLHDVSQRVGGKMKCGLQASVTHHSNALQTKSVPLSELERRIGPAQLFASLV
jgi:hypothetical protein